MKVLYIGNYRDSSGWGAAAEANILAMNSAGIDVVVRPISFGKQKNPHPIITELEKKECKGVDICVQHVLPEHYYYNSKLKNIGFYCYETKNLEFSGWKPRLKMMDDLWVMSLEDADTADLNDLSASVVRFSIDPDKYNPLLRTGEIVELSSNQYNFVFVGDWNKRKDILSLLRAYYTEFHPSEPVGLLIKLTSSDTNRCLQEFNKLNDYVRSGLKIRKNYQNISVVCGDMEFEHYTSILNQCHCFICPSHGESCCIPAVEAQALGLDVIATQGIGLETYLMHGFIVQSSTDDCFGMESSLPEIQTAKEQWRQINVSQLRVAMRSFYQNEKWNKLEKSQKYKEVFNHKYVGEEIKWILSNQS